MSLRGYDTPFDLDHVSLDSVQPSDPILPLELLEAVIDQASNSLGRDSLRSLSLTCSALLPRSRYHIFSSVVIRSVEQLASSGDFLNNHPWIPPLVQKVTLSISVPKNNSTPNLRLLDIVPIRLFQKLHNLRQWSMRGDALGRIAKARLAFHHIALIQYRKYSTCIEKLELAGIPFEDVSDFIGLVSAFTNIRSLTCSEITFRTGQRALQSTSANLNFQWNRNRCLKVTTSVDIRASEYLLVAHSSTLETLTIVLVNHAQRQPHDYSQRLERSMQGLFCLSSLTLVILCMDIFKPDTRDGDSGSSRNIRRAVGLLNANRTHLKDVGVEFKLDPIASLGLSLFCGDITSEQCKALEESLLAVPVSRILFHDPVNTRREGRAEFWSPTIKRAFPRLNHQGLLEFQRTKPETPDPLGHEASINCLVASCDGKWIATGSSDGTIIVWDTLTGTIVKEWVAHRGPVLSLGLSPDGRLVSAGGASTQYDIGDDVHRTIIPQELAENVASFTWCPDGSLIALGFEDGTVRIWDAQTFQLRDSDYPDDMYRPRYMQFSPDSSCLAWASFSRTEGDCFTVWRPLIGERARRFYSHPTRRDVSISTLSFDPQGRRIATTQRCSLEYFVEDVVRIWDIQTGAVLAILAGHSQLVVDVSFSPDGRSILSASHDSSAKVWDAESGEETASFEADGCQLSKACFSPDGTLVATASVKGMVRVWRVRDASCSMVFSDHRNAVQHITFSADGEALASGDSSGIVHIYHLPSLSIGQ